VNWFLNLLDCNVIEREIKREKVQMKPPIEKKKKSLTVKNMFHHLRLDVLLQSSTDSMSSRSQFL
jgi:hypothetical protein